MKFLQLSLYDFVCKIHHIKRRISRSKSCESNGERVPTLDLEDESE